MQLDMIISPIQATDAPAELLTLLLFDEPMTSGQQAAVLDWLADGAKRWWAGEVVSLSCGLDVGATAGRSQTGVRDYWLVQASRALHEPMSYPALAAAIVRFERMAWPIYKDLQILPTTISDFERCLLYARRVSGKPLPAKADALRKVIGKTFRAD